MSFKTLFAKAKNQFASGTTAENLTRLKKAVETDHDIVVQKAAAKYEAGLTEVKTAAQDEVAAIHATLRSAARRAEAILAVGVLEGSAANAASTAARARDLTA